MRCLQNLVTKLGSTIWVTSKKSFKHVNNHVLSCFIWLIIVSYITTYATDQFVDLYINCYNARHNIIETSNKISNVIKTNPNS